MFKGTPSISSTPSESGNTESTLELANISRARSSNLAIALWCLSRERRKDALVFYSFCRVVDDIADDMQMPTTEKFQRLDKWDDALATGVGLPSELAMLMQRYELPSDLLREIVAGCRRDVSDMSIVYETFEELRSYCWQVAGAVGVAAARIFGAHSPQAREYAEHLGFALQLTNIIRDVREDAEMRRVYLPAELLADPKRFAIGYLAETLPDNVKLATDDILALHDTPVLRVILECLADTAISEFVRAKRILRTLPTSEVTALRPAQVMAAFYSSLLDQMHCRNYDTILRRPSLSSWCKLAIFLKNAYEIRKERKGKIDLTQISH